MPHCYNAFGLTFRSERPLPSMAACEIAPQETVDVEIVEGFVPPADNPVKVHEMLIAVSGSRMVIEVPGAAIYQVDDGRRITVQPAATATLAEIDSYLLGSVFGAVLHQRAILPLHGNAIVVSGRAFLFCGDSGAGKSTLAAYFQAQGCGLLTDDLCAVRADAEGTVTVSPGIARLKLWDDALAYLSRPVAGLAKVAWSDEKYELPIENIITGGPFPIAAIYHLRESDTDRPAGIHRLEGLAAVSAITANIYRRRLADLTGGGAGYLAMTTKIVRQVPIFSMNREWGLENFAGEANLMMHHMGVQAAAGAPVTGEHVALQQ